MFRKRWLSRKANVTGAEAGDKVNVASVDKKLCARVVGKCFLIFVVVGLRACVLIVRMFAGAGRWQRLVIAGYRARDKESKI